MTSIWSKQQGSLVFDPGSCTTDSKMQQDLKLEVFHEKSPPPLEYKFKIGFVGSSRKDFSSSSNELQRIWIRLLLLYRDIARSGPVSGNREHKRFNWFTEIKAETADFGKRNQLGTPSSRSNFNSPSSLNKTDQLQNWNRGTFFESRNRKPIYLGQVDSSVFKCVVDSNAIKKNSEFLKALLFSGDKRSLTPSQIRLLKQFLLCTAIQANLANEILKRILLLQAITQVISFVLSVRILFVGTLKVQCEILLRLQRQSLYETDSWRCGKNILSVSEPKVVVMSMEEQQRGEVGFYHFGGQGGQVPVDEEMGDGRDLFEGDGMFGFGGEEELVGRIPNFLEDEEAEDELGLGRFEPLEDDRALRRVPSIGDVPEVGNFFEDEYCEEMGLGGANDWQNAPLVNHDVIEMILGQINDNPAPVPNPAVPPIEDQLPMEEVLLDLAYAA